MRPQRWLFGVMLALAVSACAAGAGQSTTAPPAQAPSTTEGPASSTPPEETPNTTATQPPSTTDATVTTSSRPGCADVVEVSVRPDGERTYRFDVTVRSPDTGWEKYADRWEVRAPDGTVLGERILTHPHVDEQPFTRSESGIAIPAGVDTVVVAAHDLVEGFCGQEVAVAVPSG